MSRTVLRHCRLFSSGVEGARDDASVVVEDGQIAFAGPDHELTPRPDDEEVDLEGSLLTAGLIDAHTHPLYGGDRFAEIALRTSGASYSEIAAAGGGIASSVQSTRSTPAEELGAATARRLASWLRGGTTTVEVKTGYHLTKEGELGGVSLLAGLAGGTAATGPLPSLEVTFLAGHALPPEWEGDPDGFAAQVASWAPLARERGARHADVFCDAGYFTNEQSRLMLRESARAGLIPRIHADELALTGGAELAAELGCASADHLLKIDEAGICALAAAGVVATLAPMTALTMGESPPARRLAQAGVTIALGTDHNPGTCGTTQMSLVIAIAVAELGMSVEEALVAATAGSARSLRLIDRGRIEVGLRGDLVSWEAEHEGAFAWAYGLDPRAVWMAGEAVRI